MNIHKAASLFAVIGFAMAALPVVAQEGADTHNFPTIDRVEYVHICQRDNGERPPHEMLYKCSCVIDAIAKEMTYDQYVESSTAFYAFNIAGERGQVIRNESTSRGLADQFKSLQVKAKKSCLVEK